MLKFSNKISLLTFAHFFFASNVGYDLGIFIFNGEEFQLHFTIIIRYFLVAVLFFYLWHKKL